MSAFTAPRRILFAFLALVLALAPQVARAVDAVPVSDSAAVIDLVPHADFHIDHWGNLEVSTAPDADGVVQRIEVSPAGPDTRHWAVIGLHNPGDEQLDRLLVAQHHRLVGSAILSPDLGARRLAAISPNEGFPPSRLSSAEADVFLLTLDPGATVTFVLELTTPDLPSLRLWEPEAYSESENAYTLYKGIVVGISGLLALFFLVVFVIKGQLMFASAAGLAWVVFGYVLVDFAFLANITATRLENDASLRAFAEAMLVLTLAAFLVSYLNITRWRFRNTYALLALVPLALAAAWFAQSNPVTTAAVARVTLPLVGLVGLVLILVSAVRGNERAVLLLPTWLLLLAWIIGAGLTATGAIDNDFVQPALNGGLVLLVLLIGFTVMQHAFASTSISSALAKDVERDVLSLAGSGDIVWDWDVAADRIACGADAETRLGLDAGELQGPPQDWFHVLHPQDRDRFRATLDAMTERRRGRINDLFRFRGVDGHYRWFRLRARPVIGTTSEVIRCVGTLVDLTEEKTMEERLLHDSVYDNLTGLPNRYLFLDRIEMARAWSNEETAQLLFVAVVNPDEFGKINDEFGQSVGDSVLLTIARRLSRILKRHDSIARLAGDSFGLLVYCNPAQLEAFTTRIRDTLRQPVPFADTEISVAVSIGLAPVDLDADSAMEILDNAELALRRAKRQGGDRAELFDPLMRRLNMSGRSLARDLKRAIDEDRVKFEFRPVKDLTNGRTVGYEALPSWHHPLQGPLSWAELLGVAAQEGMALPLALSTIERCAGVLGGWRAEGQDLRLLIALPTSEVFRSELIADVKSTIARHRLDPSTLQLGVTEGVVSDNPEHAAQILTRLRDVGSSPWLLDFAQRTTALPTLHRLPLDGVRLDEHFTAAGPGARRAKLISALFGLVTALEARVMVAGVRTEKEGNDLAALGARYAVGPVFGRPVTARAAPASATAIEHVAAE